MPAPGPWEPVGNGGIKVNPCTASRKIKELSDPRLVDQLNNGINVYGLDEVMHA
jgi:hypothetical protein